MNEHDTYLIDGYYVYRLMDAKNHIIYVGRTVNLEARLKNHHALSSIISKIEYIKCDTYADMLWKEVYYINLFKSGFIINKENLSLIDWATDLNLNDKWIEFDYNRFLAKNCVKLAEPTDDYLGNYKHKAQMYYRKMEHLYFLEKNIYYHANIDYYKEKYGDIDLYIGNLKEDAYCLWEYLRKYKDAVIKAKGANYISNIKDFWEDLKTTLREQNEEVLVLEKKLRKKRQTYETNQSTYASDFAKRTIQATIHNLELHIEYCYNNIEFAPIFAKNYGIEL